MSSGSMLGGSPFMTTFTGLPRGSMSVETMMGSVYSLLNMFNYHVDMLPLLLVILNDAHCDVEEAYNRIHQGG
ncbi:unnamed protein product [Timema podura]|uniref:Doublesex dimerisation domain-containing protein n=1 Tax=Timema podura TaxID=61482 RepID=A0ABN7NGV3_TIMPD|nr:unnamed protein product [Timema podura]